MVTVLMDQVDGSQDDVVYINSSDTIYGVGQGFTGNGAKIYHARFHIGSSFPVLGSFFRAAIYAHSGAWGSGVPTGTPIAVSETIDAPDLTPDNSGWVTFQFTGNNQFQTVAGQHYFIVFEYENPAYPLYANVHIYFTAQSSAFNGGSFVCFNNNQWEIYGSNLCLCFQLYGSLPYFSVTYNGNGATGGSVPVDSNTYNKGTVVTVATNSGNLVRTNYIFKGWSTSSSGTAPTYINNNNNNTITPATFIMSSSNTVLFAVWDLASNQTYTVIYNGNGNTSGSTPTDNNSPYQADNTVTVLNQGSLTKSNHTFLGWSTDNTATSPLYTTSSTFTINCAMVLYAIWIPLRTVTYNGNGATSGSTPSDSNSPYIDGSSVVVMGQNTLLKTKHVFIGWSTDNTAFLAQYTPTSTFIITGGNVILYAVWRELCTITYEAGTGGSGSAPVDSNNPYVAGSSVMVLGKGGLVHGGGYVFLGWYCSTTGSYYIEDSAFTIWEDMTLEAVWDPVPPTPFYVLYSGNGNTSGDVPVDHTTYTPNSYAIVLDKNTLTKTSHTFLGWSKISSDTSEQYKPGSKLLYINPTILYAIWKQDSTFSVTYDGNGNTGGSVPVDNGQYQENAIVTVKTNTGNLVKSGHTFKGWARNSAIFTPDFEISPSGVTPSTFKMGWHDIVLYAVWSPNTSSGFDGGTINKSLEIKCHFPYLDEANDKEVMEWLFRPDNQLSDRSALIRFLNTNPNGQQDSNLMQHLDIYGVFSATGKVANPGLMVGHHLFFRGDLQGRGVLGSYEGVVVLHGGKRPVNIPSDEDAKNRQTCGWAPTENPMIWLAEGGMGGNPNAETLEIRKTIDYDFINEERVWGWGNLEASNIIAHGDIVPADNFAQNLGSADKAFHKSYAHFAYVKSGQTFGCERGKSGQIWQQTIQSESAALEALTREVTKTLHHVAYSEKVEDEIICVCGKSVKHPCPEHVEAWNERYCRNETLRSEASSFLLLEHAATITRLQTTIEEMTEKMRLLDEKIAQLTKGKDMQ